jgi:hypothetical protein
MIADKCQHKSSLFQQGNLRTVVNFTVKMDAFQSKMCVLPIEKSNETVSIVSVDVKIKQQFNSMLS